ncbi:hypothetical protein Btru_033961 [Bulinus truncatus]|nr:hypothetical protein Btru_033961 [Bulinus truncatus]
MEFFKMEDVPELTAAFSDHLSVNSDTSSIYSGNSGDSLRPYHSRVHTSFAEYSGETTPTFPESFDGRHLVSKQEINGSSHMGLCVTRPGANRVVFSSPRRNRGFQGRPAIKSSRAGSQVPHSAWSSDSSRPQSLAPRGVKTPNHRLLLTGDGLRRSSSSQTWIQDRSKTLQRSKTTTTFGGLKTPDASESHKKTARQGKHCDACAVEYIKQNWKNPSITEQDRRSNMIIAEILDHKRPRADVKAFYEPLQLLSDQKGQFEENFVFTKIAKPSPVRDYRLLKEPANLHTVCLPKKGLIKLTSMPYELNNPEYYDNRQRKPAPDAHWEHGKFRLVDSKCHGLDAARRQHQLYHEALYGSALPPQSSDAYRGQLIRNKSILKQIKQGEVLMPDMGASQHHPSDMRDEDDMLDTLVGGILLYEIPDVPHLNTTLQRFIGGESLNNSPRPQRGRTQSKNLSDDDGFTEQNISLVASKIASASGRRIYKFKILFCIFPFRFLFFFNFKNTSCVNFTTSVSFS